MEHHVETSESLQEIPAPIHVPRHVVLWDEVVNERDLSGGRRHLDFRGRVPGFIHAGTFVKLFYRLRRTLSLVVRRAVGADREPVRQLTQRDFEYSALMLGFTAGAGAMAFAFLVIVTFYWSPTCGL
jgi:hypothetical protein